MFGKIRASDVNTPKHNQMYYVYISVRIVLITILYTHKPSGSGRSQDPAEMQCNSSMNFAHVLRINVKKSPDPLVTTSTHPGDTQR